MSPLLSPSPRRRDFVYVLQLVEDVPLLVFEYSSYPETSLVLINELLLSRGFTRYRRGTTPATALAKLTVAGDHAEVDWGGTGDPDTLEDLTGRDAAVWLARARALGSCCAVYRPGATAYGQTMAQVYAGSLWSAVDLETTRQR